MERIKDILEFEKETYKMGFITSYNIINMILDEIPGERNDLAIKLLEKRDELLKPLNDFVDELMSEIGSGKELSEILK